MIVSESNCGANERRLLKDLLDKYNTLERPVANESEALEVKFGITLQQIIDVVSFILIRTVKFSITYGSLIIIVQLFRLGSYHFGKLLRYRNIRFQLYFHQDILFHLSLPKFGVVQDHVVLSHCEISNWSETFSTDNFEIL